MKELMRIYKKLYAHFGPRRWWPAETPFEVMVGAILTQNASWSNAEKAIANLKKEKFLSPRKLEKIDIKHLSLLIKPSGFYKEKAKKLKTFVKFLRKHPKKNISREGLLKIKGIGPETADSILLYALKRRVFVVDAYTRRIFSRHRLISEHASYDEIQGFFADNLPRKLKLFNEYHALIVETGKNYCKKKKPFCEICPLGVAKNDKNMV